MNIISELLISSIGTVPAYKPLSLGGIQVSAILHSVLPPKFETNSFAEKRVSMLIRSPANARILGLLLNL